MPEDGIDEGAPGFGTGSPTQAEQQAAEAEANRAAAEIAAANEQERLNLESAAREAAAQVEATRAADQAAADHAALAAAAEAEKNAQSPPAPPLEDGGNVEPDVEEPAPGSTAAEGLPSLAPSADDYKRWQEQGFVGEQPEEA